VVFVALRTCAMHVLLVFFAPEVNRSSRYAFSEPEPILIFLISSTYSNIEISNFINVCSIVDVLINACMYLTPNINVHL
jgi:hypothetical protein